MTSLYRVCLGLCLLLVLAGCGHAPAEETVRFWAVGREAEVVAGLLAQFERDNPQIKVELQAIPLTAAHEKLLTAFAADALPDVCQLGNTWVAEFAQLKTLEPLQPWIARSQVVDPEDYFAGIWDTNVIAGQVVGVPWYVDTRLLFYRKDILRAAGVEQLPVTWAEWNQAMAAVKRYVGPDRYAILMPLNEFEQLLSLGLQSNDPLLRDGDDYGNFRSPGFARALDFYANVFAQGWAPKLSETQVSNVWDLFFKGQFSFYLSGPWNIREFRRREPTGMEGQWGTMPLPGPDGPGAGIAGGSSLVIFRASEHKAAAWKLIEFLSRPDIQQRFHALIGDLPPRRSTWRAPELAGDALARAFAAQLERTKPTPKVLEWERIAQEMRLVSERVVRGGLAQDQALIELDQQVDRILGKRRWVQQRQAAASAPRERP